MSIVSEHPNDFDSVLDLSQHQHRRIILGALAEEQRPVTLDDLTKAVLKHNHQIPVTEASEDLQTKIRHSLHHVHLPKLASEGLIDYDPARQLVESTAKFEKVWPTVSAILEADPSLEEPIEL